MYEFVPNKSLEDHLFPPPGGKKGMEPLPWLARVSVAADAAKGLAFLHDEGENQVRGREGQRGGGGERERENKKGEKKDIKLSIFCRVAFCLHV